MAVSTPSTKTEVLKSLIDEIFAQRRITRQVQHELMQILLSRASLSQQEKALANQVFEAIQQGRLRIVD
jgi:transcriptional regulator CtsR